MRRWMYLTAVTEERKQGLEVHSIEEVKSDLLVDPHGLLEGVEVGGLRVLHVSALHLQERRVLVTHG